MPKLPTRRREVLLALDPATKCGWATDTASGVWDLRPKRDESAGMRVIRFKSKIEEVCEAEHVTMVIFERPGGRNKGAIITQSELQGVVKLYCEERGIEYRAYSSTEIKRHATGKGNAKKEKVVEAAQDKLGYTGNDDNEADALWLLHLAKHDLNLR